MPGVSDRQTLTTAQLAERTGVPAGTLRVWETRHGFPAPVAGGRGRARYTEADADRVLEVRRLRDAGLSMSAAVGQVLATHDTSARATSVFAELRDLRPDLQPHVMSKRALLALTHAIEDEHCARAGTGLLVGSFQRVRHYRESERRWRQLARTVELAVAFADFRALRMPGPASGRGTGSGSPPAEVPIPEGHQLGREWTLIVNSPGAHACLSAWEMAVPHAVKDRDRRFEVVWSAEPDATHDATLAAVALLREHAPPLAERVPVDLDHRPVAGRTELRFAADLAARAFSYAAALV